MNKLFFIFSLILTLSIATVLGDTIDSEGFESGSFPSEWYVYNDAANRDWIVNTEDPNAGTYHAHVWGTGSEDNSYLEANISTEGYTNINVSYYRRLVGMDGTDDFIVEWHDGTSYSTLEQLGGEAENGDYVYKSYALPAGAANNSDFRLRFTCEAGAISEGCLVDDVLIIGANSSNGTSPPDTIDVINDALINYSIENESLGFSINLNINYDDNGTWTPVNRTLVLSDTVYEYEVTTGIYEAYFKNLPSSTSTVMLRRGIEIAYDPNGIYWDSTTDDDIIDANPSGAGDPDPSDDTSFLYPDAYGTGIDLKYTYFANQLKEFVIIDNRTRLGDPPGTVLAGDNITFKHEFALHNVNDADLYVNGTLWSETGTAQFVQEAYFEHNGTIIFRLDTPYAFDSAGSEVYGWYNFRRTLGDLWVELHIPFDWINSTNTTYPIYLDPTTEVEINGTVVINLSDETYNPLRQIILYNVSDNGENYLMYDNFAHDHNDWSDEFAIDPTHVDFGIGTVMTKNATGDLLYKCIDWNMTSGECYGDWELAADITKGQQYNFTLTPEDPGFAEYEIGINETTTSSLTYVNASTMTFNITRPGDYLLLAVWQQRGSTTAFAISGRVLFDGDTISEFTRHPKSTSPTSQFPTYMSHEIIDMSAGEHTVVLQHNVGNAIATSYIKNVRIIVFDVDVDEFPIQDASYIHYPNVTSLTGTYQNITTLNYVPETTAQYLHIGSIEGTLSTTNDNFYVDWYETDELLASWVKQPEFANDWYQSGFAASSIDTLGENDTGWIQAYHDSAGGTSSVRNAKFEAVALPDLYDPHYANNQTQYVVTGTTYETSHNLNFTPQYSNNLYLILGNAKVSSSDSKPAIIQMLVNGTVICEAPNYMKTATEQEAFFCMTLFNVSDLSSVNVEFQLKSGNNGKDAEVVDQYITAFRFTPQEQELLCYPQLDVDWNIAEAIVCDNVTRTTGTGNTHITENGSLQLINTAQIYTTEYPTIVRATNPYDWRIMIERGSNIYATR